MAETARAQWGHVAGWQMRAHGIPQSTIRSWQRSGWLTRRYADVYAVGHVPLSVRAAFMAAVLALGPGAALSHISAGTLWGMVRVRQPWIDVTCLTRRRPRNDIRPHISRGFESTTRWGIPVKTPLETVIDLAECLRSDDLLLRAINQGLVDDLFTLDDLIGQLTDARGRHGVKRIRRLLDLVTKTRSALEDQAFSAAVRQGHRPLTNHTIHGVEVDQYDPATNTVTEIDSAKYHGNPVAQYLDALKTRKLTARGVEVVRMRAC